MIRRALVLAAVVLGVVFAAPAAYAQYQPGQPGLAVIPSVATPGQQVQVQGFGCPRNSAVTISLNGTQVATTTAGDNAEGSFEATITAPSTTGFYDVVARCGEIEVSAVLEVRAAAVTQPNLPTTGSGITTTLLRLGLALVAVGGFVVLAMRQRRARV